MKKILILLLAAVAVSCMEKPEAGPSGPAPDVDVDHFQTAEAFEVPVKAGHITVVKAMGVTIAEADSPMTIWVPRMSQTRADGDAGLTVEFVPVDDYPGFEGNKAQMFQVICFEDSYDGDYDYNDLVIHVQYQQQQNIFGFGVQPVALGSTKSLKLGCVVYKGSKQVYKGLITPEGVDCRTQYFKSIEGFINVNDRNEVDFRENQYLGSTIRNWDTSKIAAVGPMRVEWYIEVGGKEIYALSTEYLDKSFDKAGLPLGLVITTTGTVFVDKDGGYECGFDWFNYPHESVHIKKVYPQLWDWLTTDHTYSFAEFYDGFDAPKDAYLACYLGLYKAPTIGVCGEKYRMN